MRRCNFTNSYWKIIKRVYISDGSNTNRLSANTSFQALIGVSIYHNAKKLIWSSGKVKLKAKANYPALNRDYELSGYRLTSVSSKIIHTHKEQCSELFNILVILLFFLFFILDYI